MRKVCNQGRSARGFSWSAHRASGRSPVHAPPFSAARRAVRLDRGGVDGQRHAVLAATGERFEDRLPMSALGPTIETIVDRRVRTIVGWAIAPACAALKHVNDTADNASIVIAGRPAWFIGRCGFIRAHCLSLSQNSPLRIEVSPRRINPVRGNQSSLIRYRP